jgi:ankyrin repeat protein
MSVAQGETPLHWACLAGHPAVAALLLLRNASLNATNGYGDTPLHLACQAGRSQCATLLVNQERVALDAADSRGRTPLLIAIQSGQRDTALLLLKSGVNMNAAEAHGVSALVRRPCPSLSGC